MSGWAAPVVQARETEPSDTGYVLPGAMWALRVLALVLVGTTVFTAGPGSGAQPAMHIAAYSVATAGFGAWAAVDFVPAVRKWRRLLLPYLLGVITVASAAAANTHAGSTFIFLALTACITAGSDLGLAARWTVVVLGVAAVEIGALVYGASGESWLGFPLLQLVGVLFGLNRRAYRIQAEQAEVLLARAEQLRIEQSRSAMLDERNRIAREIHDVLAHSLGALGVQIQAARAVLTDQGDLPRTVELLDQAQRMAADGLQETRRAVSALRSDTPPLDEALAELTSNHRQRHQAPVRLEVSGNARRLTPDASLALTRTAQEALVNTAKHAPHQPVHIRLAYDDARTTLTVTNRLAEAQPPPPAPRLATLNGGYGLTGMRERLLLIKGSLSVGPRDGEWVVMAEVPQ